MPFLPKNYNPLEETYYLQKNDIFQFLEKNLNFLSTNKKKIWETHSGFYKAFLSLIQQSRSQSQRIPSENRVLNYKNLDKVVPEQAQMINGVGKNNYLPTNSRMSMEKRNNENENEKNNIRTNLKPPPPAPSYNNYINLSTAPTNDYPKYTYPMRKETPAYGPAYSMPKPIPATYQSPMMTRSFQNQGQYNQFFTMRNNYKHPQQTVYQDTNIPPYGNQMKVMNSSLYSLQNSYAAKYQTNIYMNNPHIRMNNENANDYMDENLPRYHENFNYYGDPHQLQKKINLSYYPQNSNDNLYYKSLENNNDYMYTNNNELHRMNGVRSYEEINDFNSFEKKNEVKYNNVNNNNLEENYLVGDNDEFKIKRVNSLTKMSGPKQIDDFLANNQETRINFND